MKLTLFIASIFAALSGFSQIEIKIKEVKDHIGDSVSICAKVRGVKYLPDAKGQPTLLDYGGRYPDAPLTLVIWGNVKNQFPDLEFYEGAYICLTGKITTYNEK